MDEANQEEPGAALPPEGERPAKPWQVFWGTYLLSTVVLGVGICAAFSPGDDSCSEGVGFIAGPIGLLIAGVAVGVHKSRHRDTDWTTQQASEMDQIDQEPASTALATDAVRTTKPWKVFWGTYLLAIVVLVVMAIGFCAVAFSGDSSCSAGFDYIGPFVALLIASVVYVRYKIRHRPSTTDTDSPSGDQTSSTR